MSADLPRVLVTSFEPFHGSVENASHAVMLLLESDRAWRTPIDLHTATLPVATDRVAAPLIGLLDGLRPLVVVLLGESAKADRVTLERLAVNLRDFGIADNAGAMPVDEPVEPGGPAAVWSTLPVRACQRRAEAAGGPVALSLSAGSYLCNQAMYVALRWSAARSPGSRVGFVHVPSLPSQVARGERSGASLSAGASASAVRAIVEAAVEAASGGSVENAVGR